MNRKIALISASLLACAFAPAAIAGAQQEKMKTCNAEAKTKALKGDERKAFMKECLSGKSNDAAPAPAKQQDKMKTCNAEAKTKGLSGDARKQFMSSCLSN